MLYIHVCQQNSPFSLLFILASRCSSFFFYYETNTHLYRINHTHACITASTCTLSKISSINDWKAFTWWYNTTVLISSCISNYVGANWIVSRNNKIHASRNICFQVGTGYQRTRISTKAPYAARSSTALFEISSVDCFRNWFIPPKKFRTRLAVLCFLFFFNFHPANHSVGLFLGKMWFSISRNNNGLLSGVSSQLTYTTQYTLPQLKSTQMYSMFNPQYSIILNTLYSQHNSTLTLYTSLN